jgi:hypothetical protein
LLIRNFQCTVLEEFKPPGILLIPLSSVLTFMEVASASLKHMKMS